jgi:predicted DCC family thiol-disulfide oxidoreductase YuxK
MSEVVLMSPARHLIVLFDGACPMCRRTVRMLKSIDWLHRLQFEDGTDAPTRERFAPGLSEAAVLVEMYVVDREGSLYGGYDGYLKIAREVPLMWPFSFIGALPGVRHIGRATYRLIAANRIRRGRCTDEVCHPAT